MAAACFQPRLTTSTLDFAPVPRPSGDTQDPTSPVLVTAPTDATLVATTTHEPASFSRPTLLGLVRSVTNRMGRYASRRHRGSPPATPEKDRLDFDALVNDGATTPAVEELDNDTVEKDGEPVYSEELYESPGSETAFSFVKVAHDGSSIRSALLHAPTRVGSRSSGSTAPSPSPSTYATPPSLLALACGPVRGSTIHIRSGPFSADGPSEQGTTACDSVYARQGWHLFLAEEIRDANSDRGIDDEDRWSVESLGRTDAPSKPGATADCFTWDDYVRQAVVIE